MDELSWSWMYRSWIYNYLCNQCLSPLKLWVLIFLMARCTWYNIMWFNLSVTCDRSMIFFGYSGFLHQQNWLPWYNWNIFESGIKLHKPNLYVVVRQNLRILKSSFLETFINAQCISSYNNCFIHILSWKTTTY